jgi:hypothetical protein
MLSQGIIYSAAGQQYIQEAICSALSSYRFNKIPHIIYCDNLPPSGHGGIHYIQFERGANPYLDKIRNMSKSPFLETLFLDTDTYVTGGLSELFELTRRFEISAAHAPSYTKCADSSCDALHDFNTGVLAFPTSREVQKFLRTWHNLYRDWLWNPPFIDAGDSSGIADQPAFRRCILDSDIKVYVLPPEFNYRTTSPGRLVGQAKILHGRSSHYASLSMILNRDVGKARIFDEFPLDWAPS